MDVAKPEKFERPEQTLKQETELAETRLRAIERAETASASGNTSDVSFVDKAGRSITLRTWETDRQAFVRAYDTGKTAAPETINTGQAGYANATLERAPDGQTRVRLNDIVTAPDYRGAGLGGQMLKQVEQYGRQNNATEIYGSIDSHEAQNFWRNQADQGWTIDYSHGAYGEVHKKL